MRTPKVEEDRKNTSAGLGVNDSEIKKKVNKSVPESPTSTHISVSIWSQDNSEVSVKMKRGARVDKLIDAFGETKQVNAETYRFILDGKRLKGWQTTDQAGLEEGSKVDAMLDQISGCGRKKDGSIYIMRMNY